MTEKGERRLDGRGKGRLDERKKGRFDGRRRVFLELGPFTPESAKSKINKF